MIIILFVAGITISWRILEHAIGVAIQALYINVCTIQFEVKQIVVKAGIFPICGVMANGTIGAVVAIVFIHLFVAGVAVGWGASKLMWSSVTLLAGHTDVLAFENKIGQVVIEFHFNLPAFGIMAIRAGTAKAIGMRVILCMTGLANHWCGL